MGRWWWGGAWLALWCMAGCGPASVGHWHGTVAVVTSEGPVPAELAPLLDVAAEVAYAPSRCRIDVELQGYRQFTSTGSACDDEAFEAGYSDEQPTGQLIMVLRTELGTPATMRVVIDHLGEGWRRSYSGEAQAGQP